MQIDADISVTAPAPDVVDEILSHTEPSAIATHTETWVELMGKDLRVKTTKDGAGPNIELNSVVKCSYKIFIGDDITPLETVENESFLIGEGDTVPGLELAIRCSSIGASIQVLCASKFAFGLGRPATENCPEIPANSDIRFEVDILDMTMEPEEGNIQNHISYVLGRKEAGNRWFKFKEHMRAAKCYSKGAEYAERNLGALTEENQNEEADNARQLLSLFLECLNNLAQCHIVNNDFMRAKDICLKLLEHDPDNPKGLLRAGKVSLALGNFEEAELCLSRLLSLDPQSNAAQREMNNLRRAQKEYKSKSKQVAKSMAKHLFSETVVAPSSTVNPAEVEADSTAPGNKPIADTDVTSTSEPSMDKGQEGKGDVSTQQRRVADDAVSSWISRLHPALFFALASMSVLLVSILVAYFLHQS